MQKERKHRTTSKALQEIPLRHISGTQKSRNPKPETSPPESPTSNQKKFHPWKLQKEELMVFDIFHEVYKAKQQTTN